MAASSVERKASLQELSADLSAGSSALFHRRVVFHPARKPYRGFVNGGGDFRIETLNPSPDSARLGVGSGQPGFVGKKSDASEESGLDPELSFGITFKSIGAGLENMGNTCYLNSVLQCLTYTEPLAAYLQSGKHKNSCRIAGFCALCAIQNHVSRALQSTGRCLSPREIVANLKCISRNFRSWRQEDAHEYMVNLLESMHKCCLPSGVPSESPSAYEKSLVHKIFGGSLRSQVKCMQCSYGSNKYDPFLDLSLEINKADSLDKALSNFTAAELLDGGEREYQCQRCKQKVRARKQLTVHKPPYVLTIHLKRFRAHDPGQKIDKKVNFSSTLDLRPFVSDPQGGNVKYTLYGVLVHSGGSTRSGHYYCFVRTSSGIWHSLDDNRVSPVSEKRVLEQKAYMLFYVRDRSNIIPRKPSDVSINKNIKANELGKMNSSAHNQISKHPVQNGSTGAKLNGVASSAVVAQNDSTVFVPPRNPLSNGGLNQPKLEQSTTSLQLKNPSETASLPPKSPRQDSKLVPASNGNNGTPTAPANTNELNDKELSDKNLSVSVVTSTDLKEVQTSALAEDTTIESLQKDNHALHVERSSLDSSKEPISMSMEDIGSIKQPDQPSCEQSQARSAKYVNVGDNSLQKNTGECSQNSGVEKSVRSPDSSSILSRSTVTEASDCSSSIPSRSTVTEASDCKSHKKSKKILRRQVSSSFHASFFLRASLAIQKRKKRKSTHRRLLSSKNLTKELLVDNNSLSDTGPSTSEKTNMISLNSTHSQRKETKIASIIEANGTASPGKNNSDGDSLKGVADGELNKRIGQNGSELARDDRLPTHPNLRSSMDQMNGMLTQRLGETIVPCWDDKELPTENVESRAVQSVSIGYIGDEWDEEYDRGKRKKVRQAKYDFGGQNPFQEIASNKAKKAKIDRSRSGNQPFRI